MKNIFRCWFVALLLLPIWSFGYKWQLSVCAIFRDDAPYLKEWIEFHRLLGVEHFFLFNNLSQDNYSEVLEPYVKSGIVELFDWPYESQNLQEWDHIQVRCYQVAFQYLKKKTKWVAYLDTDEYLFPIEKDNLVEFLKDYERYGGLLVNWVIYGTSGVSKIPPDKLLIETLTRSSGEGNDHFKSIVKTKAVSQVISPHYCLYKEGYYHVTPNKQRMFGPFVQIDKIRINHYFTRDEDYFYRRKVPAREKIGTSKEMLLDWNKYNSVHEDTSMLRFVEPLKKAMGLE